MQKYIELQPLFSYSIYFPIFLFFILLLFTYYFINTKRKKKITKDFSMPSFNKRENIKNKYLKQLEDLEQDLKNHKITSRKAYHRISKIIRHFVYDMVHIKVQCYTLSEIEKLNLPILYKLVEEYYEPEFSQMTTGNIITSIEKTRKVVKMWQ